MIYRDLQHFVYGMISTILFSTIAMFWGIPTSESHGLVAGITGAAIALGGINNINFEKWLSVILGLAWSVIGSIIITRLLYICINKILLRVDTNNIKLGQILACLRNVIFTWYSRWT